MSARLHKSSIVKKTASMSVALLASKVLGIIREVVQVAYLGEPGPLSDAFNTALKIPNVLRRLFAEGALSSAFVPTIVAVVQDDSQEQASKLMTLTYGVFGALVLLLCVTIATFPQPFILFIAHGFATKPLELQIATSMLRILIFFIFFVFTSALLASALQAYQHFTVPAWGPALINLFYIGGLLLSISFGLSVATFCYFLLLGGLVQSLVYSIVYFKLNYQILWPDWCTYQYFFKVVRKFIPCVVSVGVVEINLIIDNRFASTLPAGSVTLLSISSKFMMIALGAFAVAFSTILLPTLSRVSVYAPRRLGFYVLEGAKLILVVTAPIVLLMSYFSYDIFYTIFYRLTGNFSQSQVTEAAALLIAFLPGLFFFSINRVLLNIYYALHHTRQTLYITLAGAGLNVILNRLLIGAFGALGLAIATVIAGIVQTVLLLIVLRQVLQIPVYMYRFIGFAGRYLLLVCGAIGIFWAMYRLLMYGIITALSPYQDMLLHSIVLWLWVGPLCLLFCGVLFLGARALGLRLYFLE